VIRFGYWLEAQGRNLSPDEREHALAEYSFLQNRLSLWLNYDYKSVRAHGNLLSAALTLYQGANNSGLVPVGHLPRSMLDVAGTIAAFDNPPPSRLRPANRPGIEDPAAALLRPPTETKALGGTVDNSAVGMIWNKSIKQQGSGQGGRGWPSYVASQNPDATLLPETAKAFVLFNWTTGEAISAKSMYTQTVFYITKPQKIFDKVRTYVDAAVNYYEPRTNFDIDPALMKSKTIQLSIPEHTSPEQWRYLLRAIIYGKENGVPVVITRIRQ
jgi:hypothetical protein